MTVPPKLEKIGRYQVLERVGKGGMGVLYRGFDPVLDREVAIKLMHADFSEDTEQMRPRFYREARAAAKLNHRNIVTIFEFAEESNIPYIVMEFLRGTSLGGRMAMQPPLTIDDKLNVIAQLCDGLSYAHEQGVVHRDVKPDNVFLLEDGSVKLLDFGIAKLTSSTLTRQGDVLGSASYMSPEQVGGSELVDGRADIFSTGVMLYELLCGRKPFEGDSPTAVIVKILKEEPTPIETHSQDLPPQLVAVVMKALQKNAQDRFPSAEALSRELQSIRKSLHPSASIARMDETRFASTQVMRALHEDFQKSAAAQTSPSGVGPARPQDDADLTRAIAPPRSRGWVVPAGIAAAVVVLAAGGLLYSRAASTRVELAPAATPPAAPAPAEPPPAAPVATSAPPPAPGGTVPDASLTPSTPAAAAPARPPAPTVNVALSGGYPFEVFDGTRSISAAATSHQLKQPAGKALRVQAPKYFLNQTVRIEGSASSPFEFAAPGLGGLDVRSAQETCEVMIGKTALGNPPLVVKEIAAGAYKVDIVCGGEVVKSHYATVREGQTYVAAIR